MNWLKWTSGRGRTGYRKLLLLTSKWPIPFDIYLLHYPQYSFVSEHMDPVPGMRHYRLNIFLKKGRGGEFHCEEVIYGNSRIQFFRPDINRHQVTQVHGGSSRYVLSVGWCLKGKS